MSLTSDDALLDSLAAALAPTRVEPSREAVQALRALVTRDDVVVPLPVAVPARQPWRRAVAVAAAVVVLVVAAGAVALSTGSSLPNRLRAPVRALGLPVDSAAVAQTRTAMAGLRAALDQPDVARVARARADVLLRLAHLDADERHSVASEARQLLERADARLGVTEIGDPAQLTRPSATPGATPGPSAPSSDDPVVEPTPAAGPVTPTAPRVTTGEPDEGPATTVTTEAGGHGTERGDD